MDKLHGGIAQTLPPKWVDILDGIQEDFSKIKELSTFASHVGLVTYASAVCLVYANRNIFSFH